MLLVVLIIFAFLGILFSSFANYRSLLIPIFSIIGIALFSVPSLAACLCLSLINFYFIRNLAGRTGLFILNILLNVLALFFFHLYEGFYEEYKLVPLVFGFTYLSLQFIDYSAKVYFKQNKSPASIFSFISASLYLPKFFMGPIASLEQTESEIASSPIEKVHRYYGLNRILLGLFKKLVLAESLSLYVNSILDFRDPYPGITILCGACLYSLQLYFDFSGYCDIAIGVSTLWQVNLPENFSFPFQQKTWVDFWKSWHSSLTNWLWQYLFMPLYVFLGRKNLSKNFVFILCIICVFSGMAFFNGIKSGFYISAGLFAIFYLVQHLFLPKPGSFSTMFIFLLFSIGLLFFRSNSLADCRFLAERMIDFTHFFPNDWTLHFFAPIASGGTLPDYFNLAFTLLLCLSFLFFEKKIFSHALENKIHFLFWFIGISLLLIWGIFSSGSRFIYMQF